MREEKFPHVENPKYNKQINQLEKLKYKKKLNFSSSSSPTSFYLVNLHKHMLGMPLAQSHGAEADCLALLRTTAVLGEDWINWVKDNCYVFSNCEKMWG